MNSLAAPIFGPGEVLVATVALGSPAFRLTRAVAENLVADVTGCADTISRGLSGTAAPIAPNELVRTSG
ncbi:hypothetical protein ACIP79_12950 [Streptomyces sp. NPDC088747]|uniref:hypothetical protein n=1 Tax=Streptomyces sp. NPDC088747 TaxID=3365886 RepID=UPI00380972B0